MNRRLGTSHASEHPSRTAATSAGNSGSTATASTAPAGNVDSADDDLVGTVLDCEVGQVAHGGHCVARVDGRVVFVRHALPGERVRALVTEQRRAYLRADAVEVLVPAAQRVAPPCPYAYPGGCGGCDLQHVDPSWHGEWKLAVVREQLTRLGGLTDAELDELGVRVQPLPGGPLGWRTRVRYAVDAADRVGLLRHRSYEVVPVERCLIAHPAIQQAPVTDRPWPAADAVQVIAPAAGEVTVLAEQGRRVHLVSGPEQVQERAVGREWHLPAGAFWQVHPAAAETFATAVRELLAPQPGEYVWDLYGGAGLFAAALAPEVGERGRVTVVESDLRAVVAARNTLADLPQVRVVQAEVGRVRLDRADLVVLDPPRTGAGRAVVESLLRAGPRAIVYVACDPAAFGRDVATFRAGGWRLSRLLAFDAFPMTHHVECIGLLTPAEA